MDPNANLAEQQQLIEDLARTDLSPKAVHEKRARLAELRLAVVAWIRRGGFPADWKRYPHAAEYFRGYGLID